MKKKMIFERKEVEALVLVWLDDRDNKEVLSDILEKCTKLVTDAKQKLGKKYVWGAPGTGNTYDCSSFTKYVYRTLTWTADGFEKGEIFAPESQEKLGHAGLITIGRYSTTLRAFKLLVEAGPLKFCFVSVDDS